LIEPIPEHFAVLAPSGDVAAIDAMTHLRIWRKYIIQGAFRNPLIESLDD
jgi:hypothetical protein